MYSSAYRSSFVSLPNRDMRQIVKHSSVWTMCNMSTSLLAACAARSGTPYTRKSRFWEMAYQRTQIRKHRLRAVIVELPCSWEVNWHWIEWSGMSAFKFLDSIFIISPTISAYEENRISSILTLCSLCVLQILSTQKLPYCSINRFESLLSIPTEQPSIEVAYVHRRFALSYSLHCSTQGSLVVSKVLFVFWFWMFVDGEVS